MLHLKEKSTAAAAFSVVFGNFIKNLHSGRKILTLRKLFLYTR